MKYMKKLKSLEALRNEAGLKPIEKKEKVVVCRKCGSEMKHVGENVWVCVKELTDKDGNVLVDEEKQPKLCGYRYIRHRRAK